MMQSLFTLYHLTWTPLIHCLSSLLHSYYYIIIIKPALTHLNHCFLFPIIITITIIKSFFLNLTLCSILPCTLHCYFSENSHFASSFFSVLDGKTDERLTIFPPFGEVLLILMFLSLSSQPPPCYCCWQRVLFRYNKTNESSIYFFTICFRVSFFNPLSFSLSFWSAWIVLETSSTNGRRRQPENVRLFWFFFASFFLYDSSIFLVL